MKDVQKIELALEMLKGQGYQTGMWVMASLQGEKHCYVGVLSRSAFDVHGHLCSPVPLHCQGSTQEIIDAFINASGGNFGIDVMDGNVFLNPAPSTAMYRKPGRPVGRKGEYQRITLEIRKDLLAKMDTSSKSRREYIEELLEK